MAGDRMVLVPGGTGYVGGRVVEALLAKGWRVRVASRQGRRPGGPVQERVEVLECDWRDASARASAARGCEAVVMLASANEIEAAKDPVAAADATSTQCLAWLQSAKQVEARQFVYLSTIHVYGLQESTAFTEDSPAKPMHPYAETHLAAELFVQAAARRGDLDVTIFRLSNAFGAATQPGVDRWTLLVNDLARQAVETGKLVLRSDGMQARDFVPMSTVCSAIVWALEGTPQTLYNLGSGRSMTVWEMANQLADRCNKVLGKTPEIFRPEPAAGTKPGRYLLDVGALRRDGGLQDADWDAELDALIRFCQTHFAHG